MQDIVKIENNKYSFIFREFFTIKKYITALPEIEARMISDIDINNKIQAIPNIPPVHVSNSNNPTSSKSKRKIVSKKVHYKHENI